MVGELVCFVVNKVESYRCPIIANNSALRNCRTFGVAADVAHCKLCIGEALTNIYVPGDCKQPGDNFLLVFPGKQEAKRGRYSLKLLCNPELLNVFQEVILKVFLEEGVGEEV